MKNPNKLKNNSLKRLIQDANKFTCVGAPLPDAMDKRFARIKERLLELEICLNRVTAIVGKEKADEMLTQFISESHATLEYNQTYVIGRMKAYYDHLLQGGN